MRFRRIGETFDGAIVERGRDPNQGVVMLREPAIEAPVTGITALLLGENVKVKLVEANPVKRSTRFELAG
ncbi:MAG TPA: hypothetical protein VHF02_01180 [Luteimonas sp.]|nr:hypothetical protein [Luteimonas sp.]